MGFLPPLGPIHSPPASHLPAPALLCLFVFMVHKAVDKQKGVLDTFGSELNLLVTH